MTEVAAANTSRPSAKAPSVPPGMTPEVDSRDLLKNSNALVIVHEGERYTLRRTSKGKLILTK